MAVGDAGSGRIYKLKQVGYERRAIISLAETRRAKGPARPS